MNFSFANFNTAGLGIFPLRAARRIINWTDIVPEDYDPAGRPTPPDDPRGDQDETAEPEGFIWS